MRSRALAVLAVTLLLLGLGVGAASAEQTVLRDARGDLWQSRFVGEVAPAPGRNVGDLRRAVFSHRDHNVVVRQRFAELRRVGDYWLHTVRVESRSGRYRLVQVSAARHAWRGTATVFDRRGETVPCRVRHRIDYDRDLVVIKVPRACLDNPRAVRATASSYWASRSRQLFVTDNPHNDRAAAQTWTRWLHAG